MSSSRRLSRASANYALWPGVAMERATQALLQAEQVITDNGDLVQIRQRADEAAFVLLARQAPSPETYA
jgi:hypothetical protein